LKGLGYTDKVRAQNVACDLTNVEVEVRMFSFHCKNAACIQGYIADAIETVRDFVASGRFTTDLHAWSRNKGPYMEQLLLGEIVTSSWVEISNFNPFVVSSSSSAGLQVTFSGRCEVTQVDWSSSLSLHSLTSNLKDTIETTLHLLNLGPSGSEVEPSYVTQFIQVCGHQVDGIVEPLQCDQDPATFDFTETMYLPYNTATNQLSILLDDKLKSIVSYRQGAYQISSCSLSDPVVNSLAKYYPDWLGSKSCSNDGKINDETSFFVAHIVVTETLASSFLGRQPEYMRNQPAFLFDSIEECCKARKCLLSSANLFKTVFS
jgi:hypothetical protein